jgi:putative hydrolase of the HAD superfamily
MKVKLLIFDLDDTLYPASSGVWQAIGDRIELFIHHKLGIPLTEVASLRRELFRTYGTTLRGLQIRYHIDPEEYLAFVHDIPLQRYLSPNPALIDLLDTLPQMKVIFTNADHRHAQRVLQELNIERCFEKIIDIWDVMPFCKPFPEAYQRLLEHLNHPRPEECLIIDDQPANILTAKQMGFWTVHVSEKGNHAVAHVNIRNVEDLLDLLSQGTLFNPSS